MIRVSARYRNRVLELDSPLALPEGTVVEVLIHLENSHEDDRQEWAELGMDRLEQEWDNPADAIYDNWKQLYGV